MFIFVFSIYLLPLTPYPLETEQLMTLHYRHLPEKDRRSYAALEVAKLGHGGIAYIGRLFSMSRVTIYKGQKELWESLEADRNQGIVFPTTRQRRPGGGRKKNNAVPDKSAVNRSDRDAQGR